MSLVEDLARENAELLQPLADGAGKDLSFDTAFEQIKAEIDKLTSVSGGRPDWPQIATGAERLLATGTKDFRLATWLVLARVHASGFRGSASGLHLLLGLTRDFWDTAYPDLRRVRGRANLYAWLTEQLNALLESREVKPADRDAIAAADAVFQELDTLLGEKLLDLHPGPGRLRATMRNLMKALPAPTAAAPPATAPAASPATRAASTPPTNEAPSSPAVAGASPPAAHAPPAPAQTIGTQATFERPASAADASSALRKIGDALREIAGLLRAASASDPIAYRILRWGSWSGLDGRIDASEGVTEIDPPDATTIEMMDDYRKGSAWTDLVTVSENAVRLSPYWLEPHFLSSLALDRLGLVAARDEVSRCAIELVERFPVLTELSFSDRRPLASNDAKAWLETERQRLRPGGGGAQTDALDALFADAERLADEGKLADALHGAVQSAYQAGTGRDRFRTFLRAGRMALARSEPELARAMLEGLLDDVERHRLEVWDPALCAELYRNLIQALRSQTGENLDQSPREALLFDKLCRLDPRAALFLARR